MTTIYLVRHCEPDFSEPVNPKRRLTETGREDAEALAEFLSGKRIDSIYSSPYTRAVETVTPLSRITKLPIITDTIFREREGGHGDDEFEEFNLHQWNDFSYKRSGGESLAETQERMITGINDVIRENPGDDAVISSHGAAIGAVMRYFRPSFGYHEFMRVIDFMPWVIRIQVHGNDLSSIEAVEEIFHIHRPYSG